MCHREGVAKYKRDNLGKVLAGKKKHYIKYRDKYREWNSKYQKEHRQQCNDSVKRFKERYPERYRAMVEKYDKSEKGRESQRRRRDKYAKIIRDRIRAWGRKNPDKIRAYGLAGTRKRRALILGAVGTFSEEEFNKLCAYHGERCLMCNMTYVKLCADHVIPLSMGGSNDIDNIQPLCKPCNSKKGTKQWDFRLEWT
jgi:5-methylcytosine-specific restriction endonuclease McrA